MTTIRATNPLEWDITGPHAPNDEVHELLTSLRAMPDRNVFILEEDQNYIRQEVHRMFVWLKDDLVANWYSHLRVISSGQKAFSTLIDHLHEWGVHYEAEGCFLTLSYLVRLLHLDHKAEGSWANFTPCFMYQLMWSPNAVQEWMVASLPVSCGSFPAQNRADNKPYSSDLPGACFGQTCSSAPSLSWLAQG